MQQRRILAITDDLKRNAYKDSLPRRAPASSHRTPLSREGSRHEMVCKLRYTGYTGVHKYSVSIPSTGSCSPHRPHVSLTNMNAQAPSCPHNQVLPVVPRAVYCIKYKNHGYPVFESH